MCGIAGIVRAPGEAPSRESLEAMGCALAHRGPDDAALGFYGRAGFSFRRLSIIDVAGGAQPIENEDGRCHVVLNGEIYNYLELRAELEAHGHRFRTHSDVETVVHGYEEWGDTVVRRLRGMFAFALWDERRERLLLARDRLGKKPLVYHEAGGRLSFASELRALLQDPAVPREPSLAAIHHYLTFQYVPAPLTAFEGVRKLPPAHFLVFEDGRARVERYWSLSFQPPLAIDEADAASEVRRLLRDAVKVRLMSEVPLGAFLSGGLDSSSVVALMAEFGPVKTFSVGFEDEDFSELPHARQVAERYGTDHHEFIVRPRAADVVPRLVEHYGEPYADSSALPTYYLAKVTAGHVKVALNGDGGDELFAGYDRYKVLGLYQRLGELRTGRSISRALGRLGGRWLPARVRRLLHSVSARPEESYARTISYFTPEEKLALYTPEMRAAVGGLDSYQLLYRHYEDSDAPDLLGRTIYVDTMSYLPDDLLVKVDIATMAVSLEGRSPFLDHPLVEFAARLPSRLKLRGGIGKRVLRKAAGNLLPPGIVRRRKMGFGAPISRWFRGELRELVGSTLLSPTAASWRFFEPSAVRALVSRHGRGIADHGHQIWALLMLELWCRRFLDGGAMARLDARPRI
jgi:asparagine synthase (glutamine-hydrolysing)